VCESHIALASIRVIYGAPKTVSPGWRNKATSVAPRKKKNLKREQAWWIPFYCYRTGYL